MKTFDEIAEDYAKSHGFKNAAELKKAGSFLLISKIIALEYARQACEAQREACANAHDHALDSEYTYSILDTQLIELK